MVYLDIIIHFCYFVFAKCYYMKQIYIIATLVMIVLTGCKSDKKDSQEEVKQMFQIESVVEDTGLKRMQVSRINQEFAC